MRVTVFLGTAFLLSALAALHAVRSGERPRRFYVLKPLTTLLAVGLALGAPPSPAWGWMLAAVALSLAGDVCLLGEGRGAFLAGLGSFLLAHLAFMAALMVEVSVGPPPVWTLALVLYGAWILGQLWGPAGPLRVPVGVYGGVLMTMVLAAARAHQMRGSAASTRALAGALLFVASDSLLATARFRGAFPRAQLLILSTYWAALGLLVASLY